MTIQNRVRVAGTADLEDEAVVKAEVDGLGEVAIYQLGDAYYATENLCTHGEAALSEGEVMDGKIYCPLHGGSFDIRTGYAEESPCTIDLYTYPIERDGDDLYLIIEDRSA